jgi:micrococcal nuclease
MLPATGTAALVEARVTRVIDGDTIEVIVNGVTERVRLIGIDTPERGQAGFNAATAFTRSEIERVGNRVWLQSQGNNRDRFDRIRRHVWLSRPASTPATASQRRASLLNQRLLDAGHATLFIIN